jgi:hypothetical protein
MGSRSPTWLICGRFAGAREKRENTTPEFLIAKTRNFLGKTGF